MVLDPLSPIAPARVRCVVLPCGRITRSRFLAFVERLQKESVIRLEDVSPNEDHQRNIFSPLSFPSGSVIFNVSTSSTTQSHGALVPFELYHASLVVLGIADGQEYVAPRAQGQNMLGSFTGALEKLRADYASSLVHQIIVFDHEISDNPLPEGLIAIPPAGQDKQSSIRSTMCDLTAILLYEMASYGKSLQQVSNIDTPGPSLNAATTKVSRPESSPLGSPGSRSSSPVQGIDKNPYRSSLPAHVSSALTAQGQGSIDRARSPSDGVRSPPVTFDEINGVPDRSAAGSTTDPTNRLKERVPVQGFGSGSLGERARNKAKSRVGVIIGSMYILAGKWLEAINELAESGTAARANSDHVWHAKALDYILVALLMAAWAGVDVDIPQLCYPLGDKSPVGGKSAKGTPTSSTPDLATIKSPQGSGGAALRRNLCNLIPDLINNILHLYVRAANFTTEQIPQVVFSESAIRYAKLLSVIQLSHGSLTRDSLQAVVLSTTFEVALPETIQPFLSRSDIASVLFRAIPNSGNEESLDPMDRCNILAGVASVLSALGYHRKKAFILREMMTFLLPVLVQNRKDCAAEMGVHPAATLSSFEAIADTLAVEGSVNEPETLESGIQSFLGLACDVYGTVLDPPGANSSSQGRDGDASDIAVRALKNAVRRAFGNPLLKIDILRLCINICEALPDLEGLLQFSSQLMSTAGSGLAPGPETNDGFPFLPIEDQNRLTSTISGTANAAKQHGLGLMEAEYWDEFLVRDIQVVRSTISSVPTSRRKDELRMAEKADTRKGEGPFIYNPFVAKPAAANRELVLIVEQEISLVLLLQNLYDIDLEIDWIKLDSSDVSMDSKVFNVVIGPYRTQKLSIPCLPKAVGQLNVSGCVAKIKGCRERYFPLFREPWKNKDDTKIKLQGLAASTLSTERPISSSSDPQSSRAVTAKPPSPTAFVANVIMTQPEVTVKTTSIPHSAVMLLEGETKKFSVTLSNDSDILVDLLHLSFIDSTSEVLQSTLANKELSPAEIHEAEAMAYGTQSLTWVRRTNSEELSISPKDQLTFEFEIHGKPSFTYGAVRVDYGHLGVPRSEIEDNFFTRQLVIPFSVTVNASIKLLRNDFLPFTGDFAWRNQRRRSVSNRNSSASPARKSTDPPEAKTEKRFESLLGRLGIGSHGDDHCLLLLDFHNSWPNPLTLSLQVKQKPSKDSSQDNLWKRAYTAHETIQPGRTSRILVLIPRMFLSNPYAPIPSLNPQTKRQFVLSTSKISPDFEHITRELFWYREEVLNQIRAIWEESGTGRRGDVELRHLRLAPRMIEALKLEEIGIEMSLKRHSEKSHLKPIGRSRFEVGSDSFLTLSTKVVNRLPHPIYPLLRLQPSLRNQPYNVALDLSKKFAFNGLLQRALPLLESSETKEIELGVVFLAAGEYEIGASVEEVRVWTPAKTEEAKGARSRAATGDLDILSLNRTERRVWYARDSCLVDVLHEASS